MGGVIGRLTGYAEESGKVELGSLDVPVSINLVGDEAKVPVFGSELAAGADLYASEDVDLPPRTPVKVETGVRIALPNYLYGMVAGRSSYNARGIVTSNGIIDSDYRGTVKVLMTNNTPDHISVRAGERIAQFIIMPVIRPRYILTDDPLPETVRGEGGFGSTGSGVPVAAPLESVAPVPEDEGGDRV